MADALTVNMRRLAPFVALSLLIHLFFVLNTRWRLPEPTQEPLTLTARLLPKPTPKPLRPRFRRVVAPPTETATPSLIATAKAQTESVVSTPAEPAISATTTATSAGTAPPGVAPPPPELVRSLPREGQIKYVLYYGHADWIVGSTLQTWSIDHDHYRFSSRSETDGLLWLFSRQFLAYLSEGEITATGLHPIHFTVERRRAGTIEQASADFDWNAMAVTLDMPPRTVALPAGAQDIVSFMYQLGLTALQPGHVELPVINGWRLDRYQIEIGAEETIDTPLGRLKAVPVRQIPQPGKESIELWLATGYRMLPVRIQFFDRDGQPAGEQVASDIRVSNE